MIINHRDSQGRPRDIELTDLEMVVKEIHTNLMDRGMSQDQALMTLEGNDLPTFLPSASPTLQAVLSDLNFRFYLLD